jgi:probable F420-dependent oxidoreductase
MQLGIHLPHIGRKAGPDAIRRAAVQAEELGFADVWVSEHVILPKDAPYPPSPSFYEPILTLTFAAAVTRRVRLGTSVMVLPMHHPVPMAKQVATLQCLSAGRVIFGIGVGWLEAEFAAMGVPFRERGRRTDESIALMRALWSADPVSFQTRAIAAEIADMRMQPKPPAPIPIWVGGSSEKALTRAVRLCDGWHGSRLLPDKAAPVIARLRAERPGPDFAISLRTAWDGKDAAELRDRLTGYREAGAGHILVEPADREIEDWLRSVEKIARAGEGIAGAH